MASFRTEWHPRNGLFLLSVIVLMPSAPVSVPRPGTWRKALVLGLAVSSSCCCCWKSILWLLFDSEKAINRRSFQNVRIGMDAESFGHAFPATMNASWDASVMPDARRFVRDHTQQASHFSGELYVANLSNVFTGPVFLNGRYVPGKDDLGYNWWGGNRLRLKPTRPLRSGMTLAEVIKALGPGLRLKLFADPYRYNFQVDLPGESQKLQGFTGTLSHAILDHRENFFEYKFVIRDGHVMRATPPWHE